VADVAAAGADTFVAGSAIFGRDDYTEILSEFRQALSIEAG
jgi:ribulose-phosphate 3-epimerase